MRSLREPARLWSALLGALLCAGGVPARAGTPDTLSVPECAALARRQAPAARAAAFESEGAAFDSAATSFNRRPEWALRLGATVAPAWSYDPAFTNLGEYHAQAGADWTLADGGRRDRERQRAALGAAGARARAALETRDAGEAAAERALHLLRLDEVGAIQRETGEDLERIGRLVAAAVSAGLRSPADSIRLALALADASIDAEATAGERLTTALDLQALIGRTLGEDLALRAPGRAAEGPPAADDSLALAAALPRAPELALAQLELAAARLDAVEASRRAAGTLALALDAGLAGTDLTRAVPGALLDVDPHATFADRLRRDLGASAALEWRLPLFDRGRAPAVAARTAATAAASTRAAGQREALRREELALLDQWRLAARQLALTEGIVTRAESHYLRTKSLYAAGATTLFDLLDALQLHRDARIRLAEAREAVRFQRFRAEDRR